MDNETLKLRFIADVYGLDTIDKLSDEQRNQSAADIIDYLCTDKTYGYGINQKKLDKEQVLKLVNDPLCDRIEPLPEIYPCYCSRGCQ